MDGGDPWGRGGGFCGGGICVRGDVGVAGL